VLGSLWSGEAVTAEQMAETQAFRGYETSDYDVTLQAAAQIGWAEETGLPGVFHITQQGRQIREVAERLTDEYFYTPWSVMTQSEIEELHELLLRLKDELNAFRRVK
jgi:hypothetical protein